MATRQPARAAFDNALGKTAQAHDISLRLWHLFAMPSYFKWPGYVGNALLLGCGLIILFANSPIGGTSVIALSVLNLYLIWKLDVFSREEVWLALEIKKAKMREELDRLNQEAAAHAKGQAAATAQIEKPRT